MSGISPSVVLCDDALRILKDGGESPHSRPFFLRDHAKPHRPLLDRLREQGLMMFAGGDWLITEAGRRVIGAPPESEVYGAWLRSRTPKPLKPLEPPLIDPFSARIYREQRYAAFPAVKHADNPKSIIISRDGGPTEHVWLSKRVLTIHPISSGNLLLVLVSREVARKVWLKEKVGLLGEPPALSNLRQWTLDETTLWQRLRMATPKANSLIAAGGHRRYIATRGMVA